jgi:negative regulator of flagellin synthesis FlgM
MPIEPTGMAATDLKTSSEGSQVTVARTEPTVSQQETGKSSTSETVSLTDTARQLRSLENRLSTLPAVDIQRVENVKQALADGSYEFDSERAAEKFLQLETLLNHE